MDTHRSIHNTAPLRLEAELARALREIRYGSLEVVIHNGHIIQIVRKEKLRFDTTGEPFD